jgi:RNA polymerase sigma factor (sigma-70 family)
MAGAIDNVRFRKLLRSLPSKAVEFLYDRYYYRLISIAEGIARDRKVSEDIVQETFVHVWEHHRRLSRRTDLSIQYYLVRVVRNKALSWKATAKNRKRKSWLNIGHLFGRNDFPVEHLIIQGETSAEIRQVIGSFPPRERECLLMRIDEDMTLKQMAGRMNVSPKAVERSMTRAHKRLRAYWQSRR